MVEIWKDIDGYEGLYKVSNLGRVKSFYKSSNGKILKLNKDNYGYIQTTLYKDNLVKTFKVHRLVAIAFIPNLENKPEVDHINTIRDDNRVENLRWTTSKENRNNDLTKKHRKGKRHTEETKKKLSEARIGRFTDKDNPNYKGFICIFSNGEISEVMKLKDMSVFLGINSTTIRKIAKTKNVFFVSKYDYKNKKNSDKLNGIRILYYRDYLSEFYGGDFNDI